MDRFIVRSIRICIRFNLIHGKIENIIGGFDIARLYHQIGHGQEDIFACTINAGPTESHIFAVCQSVARQSQGEIKPPRFGHPPFEFRFHQGLSTLENLPLPFLEILGGHVCI